jgi:hypothetical protein
MDSYDRLFPSQDTMPRGGFGNDREQPRRLKTNYEQMFAASNER